MRQVASKRAMRLQAAAARRQVWFIYHNSSDKKLRAKLSEYEFLVSDYARRYRPENIQRVDRSNLRVIRTELRRRETREFCSSDYCADNDCRWLSI